MPGSEKTKLSSPSWSLHLSRETGNKIGCWGSRKGVSDVLKVEMRVLFIHKIPLNKGLKGKMSGFKWTSRQP